MIARRRLIHHALAAMLAGALPLTLTSAAHAQSFRRFTPLLVDLPGWTGGKAHGTSTTPPDNSLINASREYQRGEARLNTHLMIGDMAQGVVLGTTILKIEPDQGRMDTSTIDGFAVTRSFMFKIKGGTMTVVLGPRAVFVMSFNGISEDESLKLARQFDWKAMQAAIPK
jgi:hypothetical protein